MRWARSYSIVDHQLLHGGYLHRLSHQALSLYLFLVVVGDREGRSFYGELTICEILRLDPRALEKARAALLQEGLVDFRKPHWWVRTLPPAARGPASSPPTAAAGNAHSEQAVAPIPQPPPPVLDRASAQKRLREIIEALSAQRSSGEARDR
jgi:hypothetical protein